MEIIIGKIYQNGKLSRVVTGIDGGWITYKNEKGVEKTCWITTFQDWVLKGERLNKDIVTMDFTQKERELLKLSIEHLLDSELIPSYWTEEDIEMLNVLFKRFE